MPHPALCRQYVFVGFQIGHEIASVYGYPFSPVVLTSCDAPLRDDVWARLVVAVRVETASSFRTNRDDAQEENAELDDTDDGAQGGAARRQGRQGAHRGRHQRRHRRQQGRCRSANRGQRGRR